MRNLLMRVGAIALALAAAAPAAAQIDPTLTGLPPLTKVTGGEIVQTLDREGRKAITTPDLIRGIGVTVPVTANRELRIVTGAGARIPQSQSGTNTRAISFATYRAAAPISRPRILHANWFHTAGATPTENDGSATMTATDWIEYPIGQTLSAPATSTAAPGQDAITDMGAISIPRGALFRVWSLRVGPLALYTPGIAGGGATLPLFGAQIKFGTTDTQTPVPTGPGQTITSPLNGNGYFPAVLDDTNYRGVGLLGDSHEVGLPGDVANRFGQQGPFERYYGDLVPLLNLSTGDNSAARMMVAGNFTRRLRWTQYVTDIDLDVAGNDISNGRSAADIIADLRSLRAMMPAGKKVFTATEFPKTSSTDSWATTVNQSVLAEEPVRLAINDFKRANGALPGVPPIFDYYIDFERYMGVLGGASGTDIVWPANSTADGRHGNSSVYSMASSIVGSRLP